MYAAELEKLNKKMNKLFKQKALEGMNIYIFGVSDNTRQIMKILRENGYEPVNIMDNDPNKLGSYCGGVKVLEVAEVECKANNICLIYSHYWREMKFQLIEQGFKANQIFPLVQSEKCRWGSILVHLVGGIKGKLIYKKLIKKYGNVPVFLCPYTGTGDIYLIGTFWEDYLKSKGITEYVFVVISVACKKVASLFEIKNIELLKNQKDASYLITYYNLSPESMKLKILNDAWAHINDNSSEWFRGYKGLYFTRLFREWVFELPEGTKPKHPTLKDVAGEIDKIFIENDLIENKTVVLSPYSNTLADLPMSFWNDVCSGLLERGYAVCTNSTGLSEPAIQGSKAIFFPLTVAIQVLNRAGGFIGVRSGFCDVISGSEAKKVILYDAGNRFYNCSAYEYFSLQMMELSDDAVEIQYRNDEVKKCVEAVLSEF
jgi:hypothetical protein